MDLFSMGVIDDEERTPRERKPQTPVRCLEVELLPPLPKVPLCALCGNHAMKGKNVCLICYREARERPNKSKQSQQDTRFMRLRKKMIASGGVVVETIRNAKTLNEFIDAGNARWASLRDLHRLGLSDGTKVAVLIGWDE